MQKTSRTRMIAIAAVGAAALAYGVHDYRTRYSNENMWQKQKPAIGALAPDRAKVAYETLREALLTAPESSRVQRCKLDVDFTALVAHNMNAAAMRSEVETRSFEPYAECKPEGDLAREAKKWHNIAGLAALVTGAVGFVLSLFGKRREGYFPEN
jgi:hypothetical protein